MVWKTTLKLASEPWKLGFLTLSQPKPGQSLSLLIRRRQTSGVLGRQRVTDSVLPDWLHRVKGASDGSSEACIDLVRF